jgi:hypothetical protein
MEPSSMIKESRANTVLNFCDGVAELFGDGLTLKSLNGVGMSCRRHDDKGNDGNGRSRFL